MKRGLFESYVEGLNEEKHGEKYSTLLRYFFPELVTAFVMNSALIMIDARFIGHLKSTSTYATMGVIITLLHFITKAAEGLSVGATVVCGQFNGVKEYPRVGKTLTDTFWLSMVIGACIVGVLYAGAYWILWFQTGSERMVALGIPYLRLRALGIFCMFVYFSCVAFLRGVKNTKTPMQIFLLGAVVFVFFDYVLIFGKLGFPAMGMQGSALAGVLQYATMLVVGFGTILYQKRYKQYDISLMPKGIKLHDVVRLLTMSWPVIVDKCIMAIAYIWLGLMIAPMGKYALAGLTVVKDMERVAFLPAIAFAQIITFLASNDFSARHYERIKVNIKKVLMLSSVFVFALLFVLSVFPKEFIGLFDQKGSFTDFGATVFPILSILVFADVLQLILAAALRGIGNVRLVMWTRFFACFGIFFPLSYLFSHILIIESQVLKFVLIYGMFYLSNVIMSLVYINKFRATDWKKSSVDA